MSTHFQSFFRHRCTWAILGVAGVLIACVVVEHRIAAGGDSLASPPDSLITLATSFSVVRAQDLAPASTAPTAQPETAVSQSILAFHPTQRLTFVAAALQEAAMRDHDAAVNKAVEFCADDPSYSFEYGNALIKALGAEGDYPAALRFILAEEQEGDLGENGSKWITALFSAWARLDPRRAWLSAEAIPAGYREEAIQTVGAAWLRMDPHAVGRFLAEDAQRSSSPLVRVSLARWVDTFTSEETPRFGSDELPRPN